MNNLKRKRSNKFIWGVAMLACLLIFVTACGQSGGDQKPQSSGNSGTSGTNQQEKNVTIRVWWPGHEDYIVNIMHEMIADFESKNPHIKVDYEPVPWAEYFQKISVAYAGGNAPDIHGLGIGQFMSSVVHKQYKDLNEFIERDNWDGKQTVLSMGTYITMNDRSNHPDEAWEFIKFWYEPENLLKFVEKTGFVATRQSLEEEYKALLPTSGVVFDSMKDTSSFSPHEQWNMIIEYLRLGLEEAYTGISPAEEAMRKQAEQIRIELGLQ